MDSQKEESMMVLNQILKDVINREYIPIPRSLKVNAEDENYFREMSIRSIQTAMEELSKNLNLEDGLKKALMMPRWERGGEDDWSFFVIEAFRKALLRGTVDITKCIYSSEMNERQLEKFKEMVVEGLIHAEQKLQHRH